MILGFVTTAETADAINNGVLQAMESRGLATYWLPGAYPIHSGPHAGETFIPFDEVTMTKNMHRGMKVMDFPETSQLLAALGGLDARVEIDPDDLIDPNAELP